MTTDTDKRLAKIWERNTELNGKWRSQADSDVAFMLVEIDTLTAGYRTCAEKFWDLQQRYADLNNKCVEASAEIARLKGERVELAGFAFSHGVTYGSDECHEMPEWWSPDDAPGSILSAYLQSKQEKMG